MRLTLSRKEVWQIDGTESGWTTIIYVTRKIREKKCANAHAPAANTARYTRCVPRRQSLCYLGAWIAFAFRSPSIICTVQRTMRKGTDRAEKRATPSGNKHWKISKPRQQQVFLIPVSTDGDSPTDPFKELCRIAVGIFFTRRWKYFFNSLSNDLVIFDNLGKICLQRVNICVRAPFNMGVSHPGEQGGSVKKEI